MMAASRAIGIIGRDDQAADAGLDEAAQPLDVGGDAGDRVGHRLDERPARAGDDGWLTVDVQDRPVLRPDRRDNRPP